MAMKKKASVKKNRDKRNAEQELGEPQADKAELADQLTEEKQEEKDGAEPADSQTVEVTSLSPEEMQKLVQEKEQQYDRLLRLQADFDNYRKRIAS
jgi:molecular chaperone GrpE